MALDSGFFENISSSLGKISDITGKVTEAISNKNPKQAEQARAEAMAQKTGVKTPFMMGSTNKMLLIAGGAGLLLFAFLFLGKKRRR
ncbi:hypothetical protein BKH41_00700 [Helicobacter sp. 12S02232-10]|uniref:LPXTG cell wall anchor domain-containing protein n=1 Tax=Helicobacter sp. 12S02232-10 TaxID=1476197 RepID=UPI000BA705A7|nr:LPXTG cell wall anchor domain-containing protein [Helicobacter sp. 12S02232-10]PAF49854.1 hypothetical protein BKH41_00700 [Helicobacter sp. 12S02232-10]